MALEFADKKKKEIILRGIGVVSGEVIGKVCKKTVLSDVIVERDISEDEIPREIARFEKAIIETRKQLRQLQRESDPTVASIFDLHLLVLDDGPFIESVFLGIESRKKNVEVILQDVASGFIQGLLKVKDTYAKERAADVEDVTKRLLNNLIGRKSILMDLKESEVIVVSKDLSPSDIVSLDKEKVKGIALDLGSPVSHAAILAGKLGIPTVVGLHNVTELVDDGDSILVDGDRGIVIINPQIERIEQIKAYEVLHLSLIHI